MVHLVSILVKNFFDINKLSCALIITKKNKGKSQKTKIDVIITLFCHISMA